MVVVGRKMINKEVTISALGVTETVAGSKIVFVVYTTILFFVIATAMLFGLGPAHRGNITVVAEIANGKLGHGRGGEGREDG